MSNKERKLFLTGLILVFSFMISGYTIRNADYMVIYEKYSQEFEQYRKELKYEDDIKDIEYIKENIEEARSNFEKEIRTNYSSDLTDRILLNISWKKFNKSYNKVRSDIDEKLGKEEEIFENDLISLKSLENKVKKKQETVKVEKKKEIAPKEEKNYINVYKQNQIDNMKDVLLVVNNAETGEKLVFVNENKKNESILDKDFENLSYIRKELEKIKKTSNSNSLYSNDYEKQIDIKEESFIFKNGKWNIYSKGKEVFNASKLIFQVKGDIPGYGKTIYWDGSNMLKGVWVQEKDSDKTIFYDNMGNAIDLSVKGMWINICKDEEIKI